MIKFDRTFFDRLTLHFWEYDIESQSNPRSYGCSPVRMCFFLTTNSKNVFLIKQIEGFVDKDIYPDSSKCPKNEIGSICNFRILLDDEVKGIKIESIPYDID